jgi:predicted Zn-dependent protease
VAAVTGGGVLLVGAILGVVLLLGDGPTTVPTVRLPVPSGSPTPPRAFQPVKLVPNGKGTPRGVKLDNPGVFLAPFPGFPEKILRKLQIHYEKMELPVEVLGEMTIERSAMPAGNTQLDAFDLNDQVARSYLIRQPPTVVIGYLTQDVRAYETGDFWNFGAIDPSGYAVISTARMDPQSFGQPPDERLLMERLRKMTTRYIALDLYGFPRSTDPKSVLYDSIRSLGDLDRMTEWPCADRPGQMVRC